jgi:hypothetical protein
VRGILSNRTAVRRLSGGRTFYSWQAKRLRLSPLVCRRQPRRQARSSTAEGEIKRKHRRRRDQAPPKARRRTSLPPFVFHPVQAEENTFASREPLRPSVRGSKKRFARRARRKSKKAHDLLAYAHCLPLSSAGIAARVYAPGNTRDLRATYARCLPLSRSRVNAPASEAYARGLAVSESACYSRH